MGGGGKSEGGNGRGVNRERGEVLELLLINFVDILQNYETYCKLILRYYPKILKEEK